MSDSDFGLQKRRTQSASSLQKAGAKALQVLPFWRLKVQVALAQPGLHAEIKVRISRLVDGQGVMARSTSQRSKQAANGIAEQWKCTLTATYPQGTWDMYTVVACLMWGFVMVQVQLCSRSFSPLVAVILIL